MGFMYRECGRGRGGTVIENARLAQTASPAPAAATASGSQRVAWSSSRVWS